MAALAVGYGWLLRRRRRDTIRFTNLALLDRLARDRPRWYRHVPVVVSLIALTLMMVALAGPQALAKVPRSRATVMLVIDVSLSMQSTDVSPTRLAAAQAAATAFADQLTPGVNLGLESFAVTAAVLVAPTIDRTPVKQAIANLRLAESTATGEAIFAALQTITTFSHSVAGSSDGPPPAQIVLMSDGGLTVPGGPDAEDQPRGGFTAARAAAAAALDDLVRHYLRHRPTRPEQPARPSAGGQRRPAPHRRPRQRPVLHRHHRNRAPAGLRPPRRADRLRDPTGRPNPTLAGRRHPSDGARARLGHRHRPAHP